MIVGMILAAGESKRFTPGNKLLYKIKDNKTVIQLITRAFLQSKLEKLIIVIGYEADKIKKNIETQVKSTSLKIEFVYNENYKTGGMSSSIRKGFEIVKSEEAVILTPADIPLLPTSIINLIIDTYEAKQYDIIIPSYENRKGHPILLSSNLFQEICGISEQKQGLKEIITKYKQKIHFLPTQSPEILQDIDSYEDIQEFK